MEVGTLKPSATDLAREADSSEGGGVTTRSGHGKTAGNDGGRKTGSPRVQNSFVAARTELDANAWRSPSPKRRAKAASSNDRSFSRLETNTRRNSPADGRSNVPQTQVPDTVEPNDAGDVCSKKKITATRGSRQGKSQQPSELTGTTSVVQKSSGGNDGGGQRDHDGSGGRSIHRDMAPKMLLAREAEAAVRRAERAAAAREKEEQELRLSSSFRAKEVEEGLARHSSRVCRWGLKRVGLLNWQLHFDTGYGRNPGMR